MSETIATLKAAWPMLRRAITSGQLFRPQCELVDPHPDVEGLYGVDIPMRDGFALTANIYRSRARTAAGEPSPVVMCAHPYDNRLTPAQKKTPLRGPPQQYRLIPQAGGVPRFSTLTSWESPDPNFWVRAGYTVVNVNLPGFADSGGPASIFSAHQGACFREAIAWAGAQNWSTGAVGLNGVSFLCISQYLAAATPDGEETPEALKCIVPWEGVSNLYHDLACRGGVADIGFLNFWWHTEVKEPLNTPLEQYLEIEEAIPPEVLDLHPLYDDYWRAKAPPLQNIRVPMLICASFSDHELHTTGTFRAFEQASSSEKWLYTHRGGKWSEYYSTDALSLQKDFMDRYLKGVSNRFDKLPPVRLEVRSARDEVKEVRWEKEWPLANTRYVTLYLQKGKLVPEIPQKPGEIEFDSRTGRAAFEYLFEADMELSGYMKLKLWAEARATRSDDETPKDLIICAYVQKKDRRGRLVPFNGSVGVSNDVVSRGYGRASRRALNTELSEHWNPAPSGGKHEPLSIGDIVPLEIALCPSSTFFEKGSRLRLIISGQDLFHAPIFRKVTEVAAHRTVIHFGSEFDTYLLTPQIP
ncbi:MAG: CocE/NonD family hydrolase [Pseudomonadota bacterium]